MESKRGSRIVLFGLDGATWKLLERFMDDGTMPNLHSLAMQSRWGPMVSTIPPVTAPAWASMATGKNPGKTGIFDFEFPSESIDRFRPITSMGQTQVTFPELIEKGGHDVVLINFPTLSYPPRTHGPVLGDVLSPPGEAVFPKSLASKAPYSNYRTFPDTTLINDLDKYIDDVRELEATRFACAKDLFPTQWKLFFVMFSATDWIQHQLFTELLSVDATRNKHALKAKETIYSDLDEYLGWFVSNLNDDDTFILVSDHGFKEYAGTFSVNRWLVNHGYLEQAFSSNQLSVKLGSRTLFLPGRLLSALARSKLLWSASAKTTRVVAGRAIDFRGRIRPNRTKTVAYSRDYTWGIYLNSKRRFKERGLLDTGEEVKTKEKLLGELQGLAALGLIEGVKSSDEIYHGEAMDKAPDLVMIPSHLTFSGLSSGELTRLIQNGHSMDGVYLIKNPAIGAGRSDGVSILDIFPTVLSLCAIAVPTDVDGTSIVGEEIPRSVESNRSERPGVELTGEEERIIEGRLRDLGYL